MKLESNSPIHNDFSKPLSRGDSISHHEDDSYKRENTTHMLDDTKVQMLATKKKYEDLLSSGKIRDERKREAMQNMVHQLDT